MSTLLILSRSDVSLQCSITEKQPFELFDMHTFAVDMHTFGVGVEHDPGLGFRVQGSEFRVKVQRSTLHFDFPPLGWPAA